MKNDLRSLLLLLTIIMLGSTINAQSVVKVNEIYTRGAAGDLDWIEVYNTSSSAVDISGYKIYDTGGQGGTKSKKLFPVGTILPAKGFSVIIVDTATFVGDTSGFGLSNNGETIWLENRAGLVIDTVAIPALGNDTSYARIPDGSTVWAKTTPRSKGTSNVFIKMNEIYTRGVAGNLDWVEIYNSSTASINISGYKIYDTGGQGGTKSKKLFPVGTILPAKGFSVIIVDTATFAGDTSDFGLSNNGETIWLENTAGLVIDTVAIPALGNDTSYARVTDGSNIFAKKSPVTRGSTNGTGTFVHSHGLTVGGFALGQNYPNPFNPATMISYRLAENIFVTLKIYDVVGREVASVVNQRQNVGEHHVVFNGSAFSSGVYFYRLIAGNYSEMKKMILIK